MAKAYAVGKGAAFSCFNYSCAKKYPAHSFSNARVVMKYSCQLLCEEISCTKGGRLALHQVLASKSFHIYLYTLLEPLLNCQRCSNSGVVVTHTLESLTWV